MLYQFHELQRTLLTPLATVTDMGAKLFTNPFNPLAYMLAARHCAEGYKLIHCSGKEYQKTSLGYSHYRDTGQAHRDKGTGRSGEALLSSDSFSASPALWLAKRRPAGFASGSAVGS